jgi:Zn-dependent protease with chaperone function
VKRRILFFLALFGVPIFGFAVAALLGGSFRCDDLANLIKGPELDLPRVQPATGGSLLADLFNLSQMRRRVLGACQAVYGIQFLAAMSIAALTMAAALLAIIVLNARSVGEDRTRVGKIFSSTVRAALFLSIIIVLVNGVVAAGAIAVVAAMLGFTPLLIWTTPFLFGAPIAAAHAAVALMQTWRPPPPAFQAVLAQRADQPELWNFVDQTAAKIGAALPDNIMLGLSTNFFATAITATAIGQEQALTGTTLHLALPMLRHIDRDEARAIVAHELAHFESGDVRVVLQRLPAYAGIAHLLANGPRLRLFVIAVLPAYAVLLFCADQFGAAEGAVSRRSEHAADQAGASATTPLTMVRMLVKLAAFTPLWAYLEQQAGEKLQERLALDNLSSSFSNFVTQTRASPADLLRIALNMSVPHPHHTHPPLRERAAALNVDVSSDIAWFDAPDQLAIDLVRNAEDLERRLTEEWFHRSWSQLKRSGAV